MRHVFIRFYALFVISVITVTVGVFVFNIISDVGKEIEVAEVAFTKFKTVIINEVEHSYLDDITGLDKLKKFAHALSIKGFVIQLSPSMGKIFAYPSDSSLFFIESGNVLIRDDSRFLKVFKVDEYVKIDDKVQKVHITMLKNILPTNMLFLRSRTVVFIMLALILVSFAVLIALKLIKTENVERVYTNFEKSNANNVKEEFTPIKTKEEVLDTSSYDLDALQKDVSSLGSSSLKASVAEEITQDDYINELSIPSSYNTESSVASNDSQASGSPSPMFPHSYPTMPKGLYSPHTGVGWKEYLPERLDAELGRASSIDQDISFVLLKILDVDYSTIDFKKLGAIMVEVFRFKDMVFEYSDDESLGFAGILQDIYVDEAVRICNGLLSKLQHEIYLTGQDASIKIGITTKDCRLVSARVIIAEAEKALTAAIQNEHEAIVGYKPSAEKYKKMSIEHDEILS